MVHPLCDGSKSLAERIRSLYELKQARDLAAVCVLHEAIDTTDSVLLQHEILYNIGQFGFEESVPVLRRVVDDTKYSEVTRHEAIESLGALGFNTVEYLSSIAKRPGETAPVVESCELAIKRLELLEKIGEAGMKLHQSEHYASVDPAPANATTSVPELSTQLHDEAAPLFDRYRAMFSLRNIGTHDAVDALCSALRRDRSSCLFRHEVAFVLGQMEAPRSAPALQESLEDEDEHGMVRHEAAEALGALASDDLWPLLKKYADHSDRLVADSCEVALEMHAYWSQWKTTAGEN